MIMYLFVFEYQVLKKCEEERKTEKNAFVITKIVFVRMKKTILNEFVNDRQSILYMSN